MRKIMDNGQLTMDNSELPKGWKIKKLGECGLIQTGTTPKTSEAENYGNYIPFAKPPHFKKGGQIDTKESYLSKIGMKKSRVFPANSILMVCIGATIGKTGFSNKQITSNQQINGLTPNKKYYPRFFYYLFISDYVQKQIMSVGKSAQATLPIINKTKWSNINLKLPKSLPEQKRIVSILDRAFEAIDKAKANDEQNLKNAKELFESYLQGVFENKGDDWEKKSLGDICKKTETINPKLNPEKKFIYIDVSSVNKETKVIEETTILMGKDAPSRARKLVKTNDVIFATVRPTHSRVALVTEKYNNQVCSTGYYVLRANREINNNIIYYFLLTYTFNKQMEKLQKGASYPAVTNKEVESQIISFPKSIEEQKRIVSQLDFLSTETKKIESIYQQKINDLEELKKSILQKAFNGKL